MDLSKLPKFSQTKSGDAPQPLMDPSAPPPDADRAPVPEYERAAVERERGPSYSEPGGPEAWISFAMAALLLLLNPHLTQYLLSPSTFDTKVARSFDAAGNPIPYTKTVFFWSDLAITSFAVVMALDALVLLMGRSRTLVAIAFGVTLLAILGNLLYLLMTFNTYGLPIMSAIAVAYGGYIAIFQWRLLNVLSARRA
jgi:hypothetical protein